MWLCHIWGFCFHNEPLTGNDLVCQKRGAARRLSPPALAALRSQAQYHSHEMMPCYP